MTVHLNPNLLPTRPQTENEVENYLLSDLAKIVSSYLFTYNYRVHYFYSEHSIPRKSYIIICESSIQKESNLDPAPEVPIVQLDLDRNSKESAEVLISRLERHLQEDPITALEHLKWHEKESHALNDKDAVCQDAKLVRLIAYQAINAQKIEAEIQKAREQIFITIKSNPLMAALLLKTNPYYARVKEKANTLLLSRPLEKQNELQGLLKCNLFSLNRNSPAYSILQEAREAIFKEVEQEIRLSYSSQQ